MISFLKNIIKSALILLISFYINSCHDENIVTPCTQLLLIGNEIYDNYPDDQLKISDVSLEGNCLQINFGASGCSGNSWIFELVGREDVLYSDPPQRLIRLSLKNNEICDAFIGKSVTFDISPSRSISGNKIILNLDGWDKKIVYEY